MTISAAHAQASRTSDHLNISSRIAQSGNMSQRSATGGAGGSRETSLLQAYHNSGSAVEQGSILRSLDNASGGRQQTDAWLRDDNKNVGPSQTAKPTAAKNGPPVPTAPKYYGSSLYADGGPALSDIRQNSFGDCYYVATLGAVANENPNAIRNAISYDAKTQSFNVTLYDSNGQPQIQNVTQAEIDANIKAGGGSLRDNGVANAAIWPDVMEVAYVKQLDTNHADGLAQGYTELNGGLPENALLAVTGSKGHSVKYDEGFLETRGHAMDEVGNQLQTALADNKPVTAWSVQERDSRSIWGKLNGHAIPQDGLRDDHVYTVTSTYKDSNGNWQVVMRNPWAQNNANSTFNEGYHTPSAFITVPLDRLVNTGGLHEFRVGD